jgi:hypothetical protein
MPAIMDPLMPWAVRIVRDGWRSERGEVARKLGSGRFDLLL